jgi:hypothetical protein
LAALTPPPPTQFIPGERKRGRKCLGKHTATLTPPDNAEPSLRRSKRLAKNSPMETNKSEQTEKKQKKQASSFSNQRRLGESEYTEGQLQPQDIARHYNELFSMDIGQLLTDSPQLHSEMHMDRSFRDPHLEPSSDHFDQILDPPLEPSSEHHRNLGPDLHPADILDSHLKPSLNLHQEPSSELHLQHSPDDRFLIEPVTDNEGDEAYVLEADSSECEREQESLVSRALRRLRKRCLDTSGAYRRARRSRGRGPNRLLEVWNRPDNDPFEVEFNHLGQPIGKESFILSSFLGMIARDGKLIPLNVSNWKEVPIELKDAIWLIVQVAFCLLDSSQLLLKYQNVNKQLFAVKVQAPGSAQGVCNESIEQIMVQLEISSKAEAL